MARFIKKHWIEDGNPDIAQTQNITAGKDIILNGNLYDGVFKGINIIESGSSRNLAFIKNANTLDATLEIYGSQNGVLINEEIVITEGEGTQESINIYDAIIQISVKETDIDNSITIGLGTKGFFPLIKLNPDISPSYGGPFWALSIFETNLVGVIEIYQTLDEIYENRQTFIDQINNSKALFPIPVSDTGQIIIQGYNYPVLNNAGDAIANNTIFYTNELLSYIIADNGATFTLIFRQS